MSVSASLGWPTTTRRCELLQHAPDGEVERVDLDGRTQLRGVDVLAGEGAALAQRLGVPVGKDGGVAAGGAGAGTQFHELVEVAGEVPGEGLEDRGALGEGQRA